MEKEKTIQIHDQEHFAQKMKANQTNQLNLKQLKIHSDSSKIYTHDNPKLQEFFKTNLCRIALDLILSINQIGLSNLKLLPLVPNPEVHINYDGYFIELPCKFNNQSSSLWLHFNHAHWGLETFSPGDIYVDIHHLNLPYPKWHYIGNIAPNEDLIHFNTKTLFKGKDEPDLSLIQSKEINQEAQAIKEAIISRENLPKKSDQKDFDPSMEFDPEGKTMDLSKYLKYVHKRLGDHLKIEIITELDGRENGNPVCEALNIVAIIKKST
jgi:hypothetical protein